MSFRATTRNPEIKNSAIFFLSLDAGSGSGMTSPTMIGVVSPANAGRPQLRKLALPARLTRLVTPAGIEPATFRSGISRSIQLSYGAVRRVGRVSVESRRYGRDPDFASGEHRDYRDKK